MLLPQSKQDYAKNSMNINNSLRAKVPCHLQCVHRRHTQFGAVLILNYYDMNISLKNFSECHSFIRIIYIYIEIF